VEGVTVELAGADEAGPSSPGSGPVVGAAPEALPPLVSLGPTPVIRGERRVEVMRLVVWHYRAGASLRRIAAQLDRSYGFVTRLMWQAREPRRGPGGANHGRRRPSLPDPSTWVMEEDWDHDSVPGKVLMRVRMPLHQHELIRRHYCKPGETVEEWLAELLHQGLCLLAASREAGPPRSPRQSE
jgi:hypothetical protein